MQFVAFRFKFDDERVTKEDMKRALEEQYGGEEEVQFSVIYHVLFVLSLPLLMFSMFHCLHLTVTTDKSWVQQCSI